jgi:pimeloyl-ACP methyl ester carboxylesterase
VSNDSFHAEGLSNRKCQLHRVTQHGTRGPILVMLHGFGTSQDIWHKILPSFTDRYRVITYDLAGAGTNAAMTFDPVRYAEIEAHADDLLFILNTLGVKQCFYLGASAGAMIGVLAAIEQPDLFRRVIMLGGSPRYLNDAGYIGGFEQQDVDGLFAAMAGNYHGWVSGFAPLVAHGDAAAKEFAESLMSLRPDIALNSAKTIFQSDLRDRLPLMTVPTSVLQMREDLAVPMAVGEYLHEHLAGSTLEVIAATGHFPHISAPNVVIDAVQRHIEKASAPC